MLIREALIDACKCEIRYRADYMHLDYDDEDIISVEELDGHTVVALQKIKLLLHYEGGIDPPVYEKVPNIVMEIHDVSLMHSPKAPFRYEVRMAAPTVTVLHPQLVMLIFPDGTIKQEPVDFLVQKLTQEQASHMKETWEQIQEDIRDRFRGVKDATDTNSTTDPSNDDVR